MLLFPTTSAKPGSTSFFLMNAVKFPIPMLLKLTTDLYTSPTTEKEEQEAKVLMRHTAKQEKYYIPKLLKTTFCAES